jgi:hypothetical protein
VIFAGRSDLTSLIDQFVEVGGGSRVAADTGRPVLILEGCGGSGRSELLRAAWGRWVVHTPTVAVDPLAVADVESGSMRPILAAVMLGLSAEVPGYKMSFPRVVLAHIAMTEPVRHPDPQHAVDVMQQRLNMYQDRGAVMKMVGGLVRAAGTAVKQTVPGVKVLTPAVVDGAAEEMVKRLYRSGWLARLSWRDALAWFRHQDQGLHHDPVRALVRLSVQAGIDALAVRTEVDDLLMAALLADLRDSVARSPGRPWNPLVLLDNGDAPPAISFAAALVRVRQNLANTGTPPDPLTIVAMSGGPLGEELTRQASARVRWEESRLADMKPEDVRRAGTWLAICLSDLAAGDVRQMARACEWPPEVGVDRVAETVYRLTRGHPAGSALVLSNLEAAPELIDNLDAVLRLPGPEPGRSVEQYLLDRIIAGVSARRRVDQRLREDLVTLSAARDGTEAQELAPLLGTPATGVPTLFRLTTLWSVSGIRGHPALAPFVRYLLLRALANRGEGHRARWHAAFKALYDRAVAIDDRAGVLHHGLLVGRASSTIAELVSLLGEIRAEGWLALLDQSVATPALCEYSPSAPASPSAGGYALWVEQLVTGLHALADPQLSDSDSLHHLYLRIAHAYRQLADARLDGLNHFLARADRYQRLADALA